MGLSPFQKALLPFNGEKLTGHFAAALKQKTCCFEKPTRLQSHLLIYFGPKKKKRRGKKNLKFSLISQRQNLGL